MTLAYLSGFGNQFATEAVPGTLPVGRNSPQRVAHGLYAELISGSAFTAPRAENRRTWMYRRRPAVVIGGYAPLALPLWKTGAAGGVDVPPDPLRWHPAAAPEDALDFIDGLRTLVVNGDAEAQTGVAAHVVFAGRSMARRAFVNADGELLVVPQSGRFVFTTELGVLAVEPGQVALLPRGLAFSVAVDGPSTAYVCENYGAPFRLPELGPIGSNGLANPRDFETPVAAFEDTPGAWEIVKKAGGRFWRATQAHTPFDVVAWHGNLAPCRYDTRHFMVIGSISFDHPDPSIFTVLTSPSDTPGTANCDFVIFPPRWLVAEDTFRPPWYHRNVMSEFMGLVHGQYDAKPEGFRPGGASLHNSMVPHGPDAEAFGKASGAALAPHKLENTLAFMFESRWRFRPTEWAMRPGALDAGYAGCWAGLQDHFTPMSITDATHDPALKSWVASANAAGTDFPIQNLPFGRFRPSADAPWRIGVAIGDQVLDLKLAAAQCPWGDGIGELLAPLADGDLNAFMAMGAKARRTLRAALSAALADGSDQGPFLELCLLPQAQAEMALPCRIGDYTDFYTGIHHATAVGRLFRPDNPLLPNYKWVPIGYHGRVSSIGISGQRVKRPHGQTMAAGAEAPTFGPCKRLDWELELGIFVGPGNALGEPKTMAQAEADWFGLVLLNDWSARDIQAWEYQPLGPFQSKNFASTISPWVVTQEALAPYRAPFAHPAGEPQPLPYIDSDFNRAAGAIDVTLEVWLQTAAMREPHRLMQSNFRDSWWTVAQLLAHHTAGGCNLQPGDLLGTGTQSGPGPGQGGSILELTNGGKTPLVLPGGETRTFLQDGDTVILRAFCEAPGRARIGLGECRGTIVG